MRPLKDQHVKPADCVYELLTGTQCLQCRKNGVAGYLSSRKEVKAEPSESSSGRSGARLAMTILTWLLYPLLGALVGLLLAWLQYVLVVLSFSK